MPESVTPSTTKEPKGEMSAVGYLLAAGSLLLLLPVVPFLLAYWFLARVTALVGGGDETPTGGDAGRPGGRAGAV